MPLVLPRLLAVFGVLFSIPLANAALAQNAPIQEPPQETRGQRSAPLPDGLRELQILRSSRNDVPPSITVEAAEIPTQPARILNHFAANRLMRNEGVSLQWISWDTRGPVWVAVTQGGHWSLMAGQTNEAGGRLDLEGFITEIGDDHFIFKGTIKIIGAPDEERLCNVTKTWRFEVTQNRSYYRLREFEWCDGLTDYIDIYFPPALR